MKRLRVSYTGTVQGVGFRYTAVRLAQDVGVTGRVGNLPDGRVDLLAEGEEALLIALQSAIEKEMGHHITERTTWWEAATGEFNDFTVAFF
ncbi:MAG: acylphosphatase [Candidatus Omnitrophota bacterium]